MHKQKIMQLYFVAIIPPDPVLNDAQQLKKHFAQTYNSKAALRSPPHITLHMPFRYKVEKEKKITDSLEQITSEVAPFSIQINGFGAFDPRVIYLNVIRNESLVHLQRQVGQTMKKTLNIHNANYKDRVFNPHLTVAFRDLRKPAFHEAWKVFKEKPYDTGFTTSAFSLLKHDGQSWQVFKSFELRGNGT